MTLDQPWLLLFLLLPIAVLLRAPRQGGAAFGAYGLVRDLLPRSRGPLLFRILVAAGLAALALAASRPQTSQPMVSQDEAQGRDLLLVVDLSTSMITDDVVTPNGTRTSRLEGVVAAIESFIRAREEDRIGLIFFAQQATQVCPLTFDHDSAIAFLHQIRDRQLHQWERSLRTTGGRDMGLLGSSTNIGLGLGLALNSLRVKHEANVATGSQAGNALGKVVVLVTDGADSRQDPEWVDPLVAVGHLRSSSVNLYAIGVGDPGGQASNLAYLAQTGRRVLEPIQRNMLPDYARLGEIVNAGAGRMWRAGSGEDLSQVFAEIDGLEPNTHQQPRIDLRTDYFLWPLGIGVALLALALLLEPRLRGPLP